MNVKDFLKAAFRRKFEVDGMLERIDTIKAQGAERVAHVQTEAETCQNGLLASLLPEFSQAALATAAQTTGCQALNPTLWNAMEAERADGIERLNSIEADQSYIDSARLTADTAPQLSQLHTDATDIRMTLDACNHTRLPQLIDKGYGTDSYHVPWWRLGHYLDLIAERQVMHHFHGQTFQQIRVRYVDAKVRGVTIHARIGELEQVLQRVQNLTSEHDSLLMSQETLKDRHLQKARALLGDFLVASPPASLASVIAEDPQLMALKQRADGTQAKLRYLNDMDQYKLTPMQAALQTERSRIERDITRYQRPKNSGATFTNDDIERRFGTARQQRYDRQLTNYQRTQDRLYDFDDYDRGDQNCLWWDVMTNGWNDGSYIPEVNHYYQAKPDYKYERRAAEADVGRAQAATASTQPESVLEDAVSDPS